MPFPLLILLGIAMMSMPPSLVVAVVLLAAEHALPPSNASAQGFLHLATGHEPDSGSILRAVRAAQSQFERLRFNNLPWSWGSGSTECSEIIGRYCITLDDADDTWKPPTEPSRVVRGRDSLILALDSAALRLPGDKWIAGQRVRYLLEADRSSDAFAAAQACRSDKWWCTSLAALVEHRDGRFDKADSLFTIALREMPDKEQRSWRDIRILLAGEDLGIFKQFTPERQDSLATWLWWLADPLWMRAGNERRTEHYARYVFDRIYKDSRTVEGAFWADDLGELLIRYGPMAGWERVRPSGSAVMRPGVVGHFRPNGREFFPRARWFLNGTAIGPGEWTLGVERTRTEYMPSYAFSFNPLEFQLAVFRRGDSAVVVAAYQLPADSTPGSASVESGLILASDERSTLAVKRESSLGARGVLNAVVPAKPAIVSVEALVDSGRRAYRTRFRLSIPQLSASSLTLSDVLLFDNAEETNPGILEEALPRARGTTGVGPGDRVSLYWEVYGLRGREGALDVELALQPQKTRWLRRTAERVRLTKAAQSVRLRWSDQVTGQDVIARSLRLELPRLPRGSYELRITVSQGEEQAVTKRSLTVR